MGSAPMGSLQISCFLTGGLRSHQSCDKKVARTVSFHNFKSQNFKLSVSNPRSKYVAYMSVLSQISNCQGLGRKNNHEILKTDRRLFVFSLKLFELILSCSHHCCTANLRTNVMGFRGFDSSIIFILRGGILRHPRSGCRGTWPAPRGCFVYTYVLLI